ncbi:ABC transporter ATP-binding protein [Thermodesulfobacteriota bacterium]
MSNIVIKVENLSKRYTIGSGDTAGYRTIRETIVDAAQAPFIKLRDAGRYLKHSLLPAPRSKLSSSGSSLPAPSSSLHDSDDTFWALKDVSFEVNRGEVVGIIGRNGAGKSTLLKILSKITEPTAGRVELKGRVGSLLEVGTGFHPELTGHENVYLYGAILGMDRWEISRKFDEIIAFAELEKFINTPVKRYSSGMYMRLAFAVAAHLEPEILLVDEVLAVGDAAFQKKCLGKMGDVSKEGRTVLFVSHNMAAIENLCEKGIVLNQGSVKYFGDQKKAISYYLEGFSKTISPLKERKDRIGSGTIRVTGLEVKDMKGNSLNSVAAGQDIDIFLYFECYTDDVSLNVISSISCKTQLDVPVFLLTSRITGNQYGMLPRSGAFVCRLPRLPLPASTYRIGFSIRAGGEYIDCINDAMDLNIIEGDFYGKGILPPISHGVCLVDGEWRIEK